MKKNIVKSIVVIAIASIMLTAPMFRWFSGTPNTSLLQGLKDPSINVVQMVAGNIYHNITEK